MKDRWLAVGILIAVALVLGRALYVPPGYETIDYATVPLLPVERCNPPLLEAWEAMASGIPFENETARGAMLDMGFDANGSVTYLQFHFFADMEGEPWVHSAFVLRNGSAYLSSQRLDYRPPRPHPLGVLTAVDDIPFGEISYGERGMNLKVFHHEENRTYDDTYGNIYAIENGTFHPLREISFATAEVWHTIEIYPIREPLIIEANGKQQNENLKATRIDEDPRARVVFAPREIGLAEKVVYA
ncbi:hypothetical protein FGU65_02350 [Methanoculleus sp. FWC-SCC1]|uniref:Uncharacterized protein n=1 Tax=Methanoculleus frigidifontis TaxID=2584085 RepID=A0ABT8M750_9EURY|nr:hypothetical protein [Methanoculleus sp. FWC-SCC1]MDN7023746.1 hypothetical protein [Methanoculleus sp. FWC-SCC1]